MEKRPIFIHSLFRTGSTYLWNKFRQVDRYYCYYEPLHPVMGNLTSGNIDFMMTRDFNSVHHPELEKYYLHEYKSLLKKGQAGIPYFKKEFSYDQFCMNGENPALKQYIDYLVESSGEKVPVLKFNRTAFRVEWFKRYYPDSLNIYLVRNPRDQWQSYHDLYRRTNYDGFFLMDMVIAGGNKDSRDFLPLSRSIPLVFFRHPQQDKENDFYRIVLGIYPDEEKYFIFYYTWFNGFIKNALHSDLVIDINRLSQDPVYNNKITLVLKEHGIDDINFSDARIEEYSSMELSAGIMTEIEEEAREISLPSFNREQINRIMENFPFESEKGFFSQPGKEKFPGRWSKLETMEKRVALFKEDWFEDVRKTPGEITADKEIEFLVHSLMEKELIIYRNNAEIRARELVLAEKEKKNTSQEERLTAVQRQLEKTRKSWTYRTGKAVVFPAKIAVNLAKKSPVRVKAFFKDMTQSSAVYFSRYQKRIDLADQLEADYGRHRSGLKYGLSYLSRLHDPAGVLLDAFIERTFCWHPGGVKPHKKPWIGFIHVPPHVPDWFISNQANEVIFKSDAWKQSLPLCKGLFVFSNYHKRNLQAKFDIPVNNLLFPTEIPNIKWSWDKFRANKEKKIIQVGWWLRKLHAIYQLPQTDYKKIFLNVEHRCVPSLMQMERDILIKEGSFSDEMYETAETIRFLPDKEYDRLLAENIVFVYLYDASANNTVAECIARNTPILINPIEPVREYLGADYPFYYNCLEEAAVKAMDLDLIRQTHRYLVNHPIKKKLTGEYFLDSFADSEIYRSLNMNPRER